MLGGVINECHCAALRVSKPLVREEPLRHGRPSGLTGLSSMLTLFGPVGEFSVDIQGVRLLRAHDPLIDGQ
jgi:hypothetical protein